MQIQYLNRRRSLPLATTTVLAHSVIESIHIHTLALYFFLDTCHENQAPSTSCTSISHSTCLKLNSRSCYSLLVQDWSLACHISSARAEFILFVLSNNLLPSLIPCFYTFCGMPLTSILIRMPFRGLHSVMYLQF